VPIRPILTFEAMFGHANRIEYATFGGVSLLELPSSRLRSEPQNELKTTQLVWHGQWTKPRLKRLVDFGKRGHLEKSLR